jgi:Flp pilus assembly protein TadG
MPRTIGRFVFDRQGVSAVEFALILPVMLTIYMGGIEVGIVLDVDRKVSHAASAMGDLLTQTDTVDSDELNTIFNASSAILSPWDSSLLKIVVASVYIDADGDATVQWSQSRNATSLAQGTSVTLPASFANTSAFEESYLILSEVSYNYSPSIGYTLTGDIGLQETFYLKPRLSEMVEYE